MVNKVKYGAFFKLNNKKQNRDQNSKNIKKTVKCHLFFCFVLLF